MPAVLLIALILLAAATPHPAGAQGASQTAQTQTTAPDAAAPSEQGSHELSSFFLIGIMINIVALILFAVWAAREWKKRAPGRRTEDR